MESMSTPPSLSERKRAILDVLVRHYIRTGEAVGSEIIASSAGLGVSSATIRNELAALEEMGYLAQPHTSAGRVPTDLAYRHYVDNLPRRRLRDPDRRAIVDFFDEALADVDEILRGTTILLSRLTRYASLAMTPAVKEGSVVRAELVPVGSSAMLLVVFDTGRVDKRWIEVPAGLSEADVEAASRTLTEGTRGLAGSDASTTLRDPTAHASAEVRTLFGRVAEALDSIDHTLTEEHVVVGGASNIASELAFQRRESLRQILEALERESEVIHLLREAATGPPLTVTIGRENPVTGMWEASVIAAPYGVEGGPAGTIGVVGPTRMDYASAIAAVRAVAERLSAAVEALGG
jgi:heat-inducible transcriptional repressor